MTSIVPAIIPQSLEHLSASLEIIKPFAHEVQIDLVDGVFVPFTSWPYLKGASPSDLAPLVQDFVVEIDCMIHKPEEVIQEYVDAGVKRIVVHLESALNIHVISELKIKNGFELGFSIGNNTDIRALTSVIHMADYVQLMGIADIGSQGQPFDERVLARITELKNTYPSIFISIDGSVNENSLPKLISAGADRFVVGSAIFNAKDPQEAFEMLRAV